MFQKKTAEKVREGILCSKTFSRKSYPL